MQFSRRQLVKFAAKAAEPTTPFIPSDTTRYDMGGGNIVSGVESRISGLNKKNIGYRDRALLESMGAEGQRIADKYNVDISPQTIAKLQAAAPKMQVGPGGLLYSAPTPAAPARAPISVASAPLSGRLNISMPATAKKVVKSQEAAYAKQQAAKATPAAPAAPAAVEAPAAKKEPQVAEGMPVVF